MKLRIGSGIDFHQLVEGRDLWIGGIKIPPKIHLKKDAHLLYQKMHVFCIERCTSFA